MQKATSLINKSLDFIGRVASFLLISLVLIIAYNVIARYLFRASSIGIEELSWHIYASVFLLGIPYALRTRSHVRVDFLYERFSPKTKATVDIVGIVVFLIPTCLIIIWSGTEFTYAAWDLGDTPDSVSQFFALLTDPGIGEKSQDPGGLLNRWIIKGIIPFSFVFLLLASIAFLFESIDAFRLSRRT